MVDTIRLTAKGKWLDLWAGAVAINAVCVQARGRAGVAVMPQGLKITVTPAIGIEALGGNNLTNIA